MNRFLKTIFCLVLIGCVSSTENGYSREAAVSEELKEKEATTYTVKVLTAEGDTSEVDVTVTVTDVEDSHYTDSLIKAGYFKDYVLKVGLDGMSRMEHKDSISYQDELTMEMVTQHISDTLHRNFYFYNKAGEVVDTVTISIAPGDYRSREVL
ncbi:MAG: hypothetical protein AAF391_13765 [Bacteroidota bacterium]